MQSKKNEKRSSIVTMVCRICDNPRDNKLFQVKEMMFGLGEEFPYIECSNCGCLQIIEIPINMEKYYPSGYYSFQRTVHRNFFKRSAIISRDRYALRGTGFFGKLLFKKYPTHILQAFSKTGVNLQSKILDVGCGYGELLLSLRNLGFRNLVGLDPYVDNDVIKDGVRILKRTIHDLPDEDKFDVIILNHSLEHIPDQLDTLLKVNDIMAVGGLCLVGIPLKTEYIWGLYDVSWVQIDAPRHFFIHTMKSFIHLANKAGLSIDKVIFDSTELQFWGSEQYKRGIPLESQESYLRNRRNSIFTPRQIQEYREKAKELNRINQGDKAIFYLVRDETK